jgi:hypothetical protein
LFFLKPSCPSAVEELMPENFTPTIHEILEVLHNGGRIDQFSTGNIFLTNIFGELMPFTSSCFDFLREEQLIQNMHLHLPGGSCYKLSPVGLDRIRRHQMEELCPPPETAKTA